MNEGNIPDLNIFMMCEKLNENALKEIPSGFHVRTCQKNELKIWKEFPFDSEEDKKLYLNFMTKYFNTVYMPYGDLFYNSCLFICDENDKPIATCFATKAYNKFYTIHWLKVLKGYEGKGNCPHCKRGCRGLYSKEILLREVRSKKYAPLYPAQRGGRHRRGGHRGLYP